MVFWARINRMATKTKPPAQWTSEILAEFEKLVRAGGEVAGAGLSARIANAQSLVCHFDDDRLVAIAAIKNPAASYRAKLTKQTGYDLNLEQFRYELGWVYALPEHQGKGLSKNLMEACLLAAGSDGVFATTRENNERMQEILKRYKFVEVGTRYKSGHGNVWLNLFVLKGA
jgi:ribosomal protein S18 acetylase RimI-like enzyme